MTKFVEIPNSDTVYSTLGLDLRAEAMVITVPPIEQSRYYSIQLIDLYTFNFAYTGSRTTGNDGGSFLVAGPSWNGGLPPGIKKVLRCETEFALAGFRTQLFNPGELDNVKKVQAGYETQPLSQFLGTPTSPPRQRLISSTAQSRATAHLAAVFQHPELHLAILSHESIREGTHGAVRQAEHRRGEKLRCGQPFTRN
jgi:hypothetical protein